MNLIAEHQLRNTQADAVQLEPWIRSFAEAANLSANARQAFDLALVEWVTNIISYGFPDGREHLIRLRFLADRSFALVEVTDDGVAFDPLAVPPVDTQAPLEDRPIGGLGIHLIRRLMDQVEYSRTDGRNVLKLRRSIL